MLQGQILSPNSIEDQKKGLNRKLKEFCPINRVKTKNNLDKRPPPQSGAIIGRSLGFIRADSHFFVYSSRRLLLMVKALKFC